MTETKNIDEIPLTSNSTGTYDFLSKMEALEEEYQKNKKEEENEFNLPISKRIESKNWKCRKSALEELNKLILKLENFDYEIFILLPKILIEQHQGNLEYAIDIINLFFDKKFFIPRENINILNDILKNLIEKCFSSSKNHLKEKSKEAIIKGVENLSNTDILCENIINLFNTKNQKLIQSGILISTILLNLFGNSVLNYKILTPKFLKITEQCSPLIKNDIISFIIELYKWIRGGIKQFLNNSIKDSVKQDIEKSMEDITNQFKNGLIMTPKNYLNNNFDNNFNKNKNNSNNKNNNNNKNENINYKNNDNLLSDDGIDIFTKKNGFDDSFIEMILKPERKWKEKKEMLDNFVKSTDPIIIPKIKNTNRNNFNDMLKIILKDPNINVVNSAINVINNLSCGLKQNYIEGKDFMIILLEFFKEKNERFSNCLMNTLDNLINYIDDNIINEIMIKYTSNNITNPSKEKVCIFIEKIAKKKNNIKPLIENILIKYTDDQAIEIKNISIKTLANINIINSNFIMNVINLLNDTKIKKIDDILLNYNNETNNNIQTLAMMKKNALNKKNNNKKQIQKNNNNNSQNQNQNINNNEELNSNNNEDEIIEFVNSKINNEIIELFKSNKWNERKDAFTKLNDYIIINKDEIINSAEYFLKYIIIKNKKFKENNINILKESYICINSIFDISNNLTKKYSSIIIPKIIDKISDHKINTELTNLLYKFMDYYNIKNVIIIIIKSIEGKAITILKETALFINNSIEKYNNLQLFPLKEIIEFCKILESNSNVQCRNNGTILLCSLYKYLGNSLKTFLTDIKESTLKVIEKEFEKVEIIDYNLPENKNLKNQNKNLIEILSPPRVDISKKITPKMLKDLSEGKWQIKKEIIEQIDSIINSVQRRILPNGLGEFIGILKQKLKDSNKNIVRIFIQFITKLSDDLGNGIKVYIKTLINPILRNLSDKNNLLREDVVKCIEKFINIIGFDYISFAIPQFLNEENYEMRIELLKILTKNKGIFSNKLDNIKDYISPIISCILDKSPIIRNMAEEVSKELLRYININCFYDQLKNLKPAIANSVKNIIDKYSSLICVGNENIDIKDIDKNLSDNQKLNKKNHKNENYDIEMKDGNKNYNNNNNNNLNKKRNESNEQNFNNLNTLNSDFNIQIPNLQSLKFNNNNNSNINFPEINIPKKKESLKIKNEINVEVNPNNDNNLNLYSVSKSPILQNKQKLNLDMNSAPIPLFFDDDIKIKNIISIIFTGNINEKSSALLNLSDILSNNKNENLNLLFNESNINELFISLNTLLSSIFQSNNQNSINIKNLELIAFTLTAYYKLALKKKLIFNLSSEIIYNSYERLFIILNDENLEKINEGQKIIKSINGLIMKLLENFNTTKTFSALIKIMLNYKGNSDRTSQICTFGIKCLSKLSSLIKDFYSYVDLNIILQNISQFLFEFEKTNSNLNPHNENEDKCLKVIKNILFEFCKIYKNQIWDFYKKVNCNGEQFLKQYIQNILRYTNGINETNNLNNDINSFNLNTNNTLINNIQNQQNYNPNINNSLNNYISNSNNQINNKIELSSSKIKSFNIEKSINEKNINNIEKIQPFNSNKIINLIPKKIENINPVYKEMKIYAEKLNSIPNNNIKEKEYIIYEIVNALNRNKLPVEYMADKLPDPNDYTSLLKIHHSIRDGKSNFSSILSKKDNDNNENFLNIEKENNINTPNNIFKDKDDYIKFNANPKIPIDNKIKLYRETLNSISKNNQPNLNFNFGNLQSNNHTFDNNIDQLIERKKIIDQMFNNNYINLNNEYTSVAQSNTIRLDHLKMKLNSLKNQKKEIIK